MTQDGTGWYWRNVMIPVEVKLDGDVYVATSPCVRGLLVVNKSHAALMEGVESAMRALTQEAMPDEYRERE